MKMINVGYVWIPNPERSGTTVMHKGDKEMSLADAHELLGRAMRSHESLSGAIANLRRLITAADGAATQHEVAMHRHLELQRWLSAIESTDKYAYASLDAVRKNLRAALEAVEDSGDHDHGSGPIGRGKPCEGGDCLVMKARNILYTARNA